MKRHQITIYRPSTETDSRGQVTGTPDTILSAVPAAIEQLAGLEAIRAKKIYADATYRVTFWGDPATPIKPTDYCEFGTKTLYIGAVIDDDQTGVEIQLLCKEDVS